MIFEIYIIGAVLTTIILSYTSKLTGTVIDGLIPILALIGGTIWPIVIITGITGLFSIGNVGNLRMQKMEGEVLTV